MATKTIIQQPVVLQNVEQVFIERGATGLDCTVNYLVVDSLGQTIGHIRSIQVPLSQTVITTLRDFIINTVLPRINIVEGTD